MKKKYDYVGKLENSFVPVKLNGKWGFVDETGKEVIECKYDVVYWFKNGFTKVRLNNEYFWVNEGETIKIKEIKL